MAPQLKQKILSFTDTKPIQVEVPEWNCTVYLRQWSGVDRDSFTSWFGNNKDKNGSLKILVLTLCDENGELLFTDEDMEALNQKSFKVLERLTLAALQLNGLNPEAVEDAKKN